MFAFKISDKLQDTLMEEYPPLPDRSEARENNDPLVLGRTPVLQADAQHKNKKGKKG